MKTKITVLTMLMAAALLVAPDRPAAADDAGRVYEVTITNLTRGQSFTPFLVVTHAAGIALFEPGEPPSAALADLAENGNTAPLAEQLSMTPGVTDIQGTEGLLFPGESVTLRVRSMRFGERVSLAAMMLPTNDGFVALDAALLPWGQRPVSLYARAYDAGSERNDESCDSIPGPDLPFPGPQCGLGGSPGGGEGYVHVHAGIHGVGDLAPAERDWKNPVAQVTIRRIP